MIQNEITAVLLAILFSPTMPLAHIILSRAFKKKVAVFKLMLPSFIIYAAVWTCFYGSSGALTIRGLTAGYSIMGFIALGYAETFSMLCRGFSLHIMIDIFSRGPLDIWQIIENYGEGKGIDWLLDKRIKTLESAGMVKINGESIEIKSMAGILIGRLGNFIKKLFKIGAGG